MAPGVVLGHSLAPEFDPLSLPFFFCLFFPLSLFILDEKIIAHPSLSQSGAGKLS